MIDAGRNVEKIVENTVLSSLHYREWQGQTNFKRQRNLSFIASLGIGNRLRAGATAPSLVIIFELL